MQRTPKSLRHKNMMLRHNIPIAIAIVMIGLLAGGWTPGLCQDDYPKTIVVGENTSVRDLAKTYLNDPNLWHEILRVNSLDSPAQVRPGMVLHLPDPVIAQANQQVEKARLMVDNASRAGAKVQAPEAIDRAMKLLKQAIVKRKNRDWNGCLQLAQQAYIQAETAHKKSQSNSPKVPDAILKYRRGKVQSRGPSDLVWDDIQEKTPLMVGERVRTLSDAYAEIVFKDRKKFSLKEGSQIIISRVDSEQVPQLQQTSPGVTVHMGSAAAFLDGRNETSLRPKKLAALPAPLLTFPSHGMQFITPEIRLEWEPVAGARSYRIQVAKDRFFQEVIKDSRNHPEPSLILNQMGNGIYFWQVAAMDSDGKEGPMSKVGFFSVFEDTQPPEITITSPENHTIVSDKNLVISGTVEPGASVYVDSQQIRIDAQGQFKWPVVLTKGENRFLIKATDSAGNTTQLVRTVLFSPNQDVPIAYDPHLPQTATKQFISPTQAFSLSGTTEPGLIIQVLEDKRIPVAGCVSDPQGRFTMNLPLKKQTNRFQLIAISPGGHKTRDRFTVTVDAKPVRIELLDDLPSVTRSEALTIRATVDEPCWVKVNGQPVNVTKNRLSTRIPLIPGNNRVDIEARDQAGNISRLTRYVLLDTDPPEIIASDVSTERGASTDYLILTVQVEDALGVKSSARYGIHVGDLEYSGYLKLDRKKQMYWCRIAIPEGQSNNVTSGQITVTDYLENQKDYPIQEH